MRSKALKVKKKKHKSSPQELQALKEQQKLLYLRQRRNLKRRQMMFHRIRTLFHLGGIMFIILCAIYVLMLPHWKLSAFVFSNYPNKDLLIDNNLISSDSQIINKLKQVKLEDKPIYLINPGVIENKLLELDPIKKAYIRRFWLPTRLSITIIEKQPLFLIQNSIGSAPSYVVTNEASKIGKQFLPLPEKFDDKTFNIILPGGETNWNKDIVQLYGKILSIAQSASDEKVIYMDLSRPKDVYIKMSGFSIRLGEIDATVIERISRLKPLMKEIKPLEKQMEYADLRWDKGLSLKLISDKPKNTTQNTNQENKVDKKILEEQQQKINANTQTIAQDMTNLSTKTNNTINNSVTNAQNAAVTNQTNTTQSSSTSKSNPQNQTENSTTNKTSKPQTTTTETNKPAANN